MKNLKALRKNIKNKQRLIVIGNRMLTRQKFFEEKEAFRRKQAKLPFEEKIKILTQLQKIASNWAKKDVIVWKL